MSFSDAGEPVPQLAVAFALGIDTIASANSATKLAWD